MIGVDRCTAAGNVCFGGENGLVVQTQFVRLVPLADIQIGVLCY
jgi:hypothetical protein